MLHIKSTILFLIVTFGMALGGIDFSDCDSTFLVDSLEIEGCDDNEGTYCHLQIGSDHNITVTLINVPPLKEMASEASITFFGQKFSIDITPNPCEQLVCPLTITRDEFSYKASIHISDLFVPSLTGKLRLESRYTSSSVVNEIAFCVDTSIKIVKAAEEN